MADAREQVEWFRTYMVVRQVAASGLSPRLVKPQDVIPGRYLPGELKPDPVEVENREQIENDMAWAALGEGLRGMVRKG